MGALRRHTTSLERTDPDLSERFSYLDTGGTDEDGDARASDVDFARTRVLWEDSIE